MKIPKTWADFGRLSTKLSKNATELIFMPLAGYYDMTSSNLNSLQFVYGEEVKDTFKGCEFHFQHTINKRNSNFKDDEK